MSASRRARPPLWTLAWSGSAAAVVTAGVFAAAMTLDDNLLSPLDGPWLETMRFFLTMWAYASVVAWVLWMLGLFTVGLGVWWLMTRRGDPGPGAAAVAGAVLAGLASLAAIQGLFGQGGVSIVSGEPLLFGAAVAGCGAAVAWIVRGRTYGAS